MQIRTALTTLTFGALTSALVHNAVPAILGPAVTPAPLVARADLADDPSCLAAAESFTDPVSDMPSPTPTLASWIIENERREGIDAVESAFVDGKLLNNDEIDKFCPRIVATLTPPASLASAYSVYSSRMSSWQVSVAPIANDALAQCTGGGQVGLMGAYVGFLVATDVPQCTNALHRHNNALSSASTAKPRYAAALFGAASLAAAIALF